MSSTHNVYDVIIIGGGLAGLGAAYTFSKTSIKYLVLEAQNYIGGRVKSKQMKTLQNRYNLETINGMIDLGAQWLHGEQNALHKIANENQLLTDQVSEEGLGSYIREDGFVFDELFHKKIDFEVGKILTQCESFVSTKSCKSYPKSIRHYLDEEFENYILQLPTDSEKQMAREIYDWHARFQIIDNSCLSLDQVSAKYWGMYSFNGESCQAHINFKNGFSSIVEALVREIDAKNIQLNSNVIEIDWNVLRYDHDFVSVRTKCGKTYSAKHILITCSLGVLKARHEHIFRPPLPKLIKTAIDQIGFGTINKIFLQFDQPWWEPMAGIQLIFKSDCDAKTKWTRYLSGFDILSPGSPNTLIGWVGSYGAIEMEKLTDEQIIEDCIEILSKFTKKSVPYPMRFDCSRWGSNEFIRGGYSYLSTKCDESEFHGTILSSPITVKDLSPNTSEFLTNLNDLSLSENVHNGQSIKSDISIENQSNGHSTNNYDSTVDNEKRPILLFAGEACHSKYFSTAHGAFLSGVEQAQTFLKYV